MDALKQLTQKARSGGGSVSGGGGLPGQDHKIGVPQFDANGFFVRPEESSLSTTASPDTSRLRTSRNGQRTSRKPPPPAESYAREAFDLYCWGYGGNGALGNSAFRDELTPYLVEELRACGGAVLVACGFDHTIAVCADLRARAW